MESKGIVLQSLDLDNELEAKFTEEKKSLVKFIHVFESEPEKRKVRNKLGKYNFKNKIIRKRKLK